MKLPKAPQALELLVHLGEKSYLVYDTVTACLMQEHPRARSEWHTPQSGDALYEQRVCAYGKKLMRLTIWQGFLTVTIAFTMEEFARFDEATLLCFTPACQSMVQNAGDYRDGKRLVFVCKDDAFTRDICLILKHVKKKPEKK